MSNQDIQAQWEAIATEQEKLNSEREAFAQEIDAYEQLELLRTIARSNEQIVGLLISIDSKLTIMSNNGQKNMQKTLKQSSDQMQR